MERIIHGLPNNALQTGFCSYTKEGEPVTFLAAGRAYYFEVVGDVDITITCGDETEHIDNFSTDFKRYKGAFEHKAEMTIAFSGNYMYTVRNIAIFAVPTPHDYGEYIRYRLPDNCYKVMTLEMNRQSLDSGCFYYKGNSVFISSKLRGEIIMDYHAYPKTIDGDTDDFYVLEVDDELQDAMCFYVAALLLQSENPSMYSILYSQYQNKLTNINTAKFPLPNRIKRVIR